MKKAFSVKRFLSSKLFLILCVVVLGFLVYSLSQKIIEGRDIDNQINSTQSDIAKLEEKSSEMGSLLNFVNTDAFLEQEARLKFNLVKPGESVVVIPSEGQAQNNQQTADNKNTNDNLSNPKKWWIYFFGS